MYNKNKLSYLFIIVFLLLSNFTFCQESFNPLISYSFADYYNGKYHRGVYFEEINRKLLTNENLKLNYYNKNYDYKEYKFFNDYFYSLVGDYTRLKYNFMFFKLDDKYVDNKLLPHGSNIFSSIENNEEFLKQSFFISTYESNFKYYVNPLSNITIQDTIRPVIEDVYFIDFNNKKVSLFNNHSIIRGGRLFITTYDRYNGRDSKITPYNIQLYIDGKQIYEIVFDKLYVINDEFFLSDYKIPIEILYSNNQRHDYFIKEHSFLPGLTGIKIIVSDINGNSHSFTKTVRILVANK